MSFRVDSENFSKFVEYKFFQVEVKENVAHVKLSKEEPCNSLTIESFDELYHIFKTIDCMEGDIRVVMFYSIFKDFGPGLDCNLYFF